MKTIKELQAVLQAEIDKGTGKATSKTKDLHQVLIYLKDHNPTEELVRKQLDQTERKIGIIESRIDGYITNNKAWLIMNGYPERKDMEKYYYEQNDRAHLRKQVKMLKLILE